MFWVILFWCFANKCVFFFRRFRFKICVSTLKRIDEPSSLPTFDASATSPWRPSMETARKQSEKRRCEANEPTTSNHNPMVSVFQMCIAKWFLRNFNEQTYTLHLNSVNMSMSICLCLILCTRPWLLSSLEQTPSW